MPLYNNIIVDLAAIVSGSGTSTVGAVVGVLLAAALLIAAVTATAIISYTVYIRKSMP